MATEVSLTAKNDFTIFNSEFDDNCCSMSCCTKLQRILYALQYYQSLNCLNDEEFANELMEFCTLKYKQLINDFNHIIMDHHGDMEWIYELIHNEYNSLSASSCSIISCTFYKRSHRNRESEDDMKQPNNDNLQFIFWRDLFDQIHCFMIHLFDAGLRVKKKDIIHDDIFNDTQKYMQNNEDNQDLRYKSCFDSNFDAICQKTSAQRKQLEKLGVTNARFMKSNKFNINVGYVVDEKKYIDSDKDKDFEVEEVDMTFTDGLYLFLRKHNMKKMEMLRLSHYLMHQEYDTDSLLEDIDFDTGFGSNIAQNTQNIKYVDNIIEYKGYAEEKERTEKMRKEKQEQHCKEAGNKIWQIAKQIMQPYYDELNEKFAKVSSAFSIGYTFFYWNYYRFGNIKQKWVGNQNDLLGYSSSQLFITKKYKSLKEELLLNKIHCISHDVFNRILTKAEIYIVTEAAKSIVAADEENELHYGIVAGTPLSIDRLLSILFYTDLTELSTAFSSTFRAIKKNETLLSIKSRNREYWNWSKLIRETVQYFGDSMGHERFENPFYTGISYMLLPSFVMRLCSPTSTSRQLEVAYNFADETGIVIQINNGSTYYSQFLRYFDCSWLSCYNDEDERLFCGGDSPLRVESVTLVSTRQNLYWFFKPLFYLDCMVSGVMISPNSDASECIKDTDHRILTKLIKHKLCMEKNDFLPYVNDTFEAFCQHKKQLFFNIDDINAYLLKLKNILFMESSWNLLNVELVSQIFTECQSIIICDEVNQCLFDLDNFLLIGKRIIKLSNNKVQSIKIQVIRQRDGAKDSWLHSKMRNIVNNDKDITQIYNKNQKNWDVLLLRKNRNKNIILQIDD